MGFTRIKYYFIQNGRKKKKAKQTPEQKKKKKAYLHQLILECISSCFFPFILSDVVELHLSAKQC